MILNSFPEPNANARPGAFQEFNGPTIVVQNDDAGTITTGTPPLSFSSPPHHFSTLSIPTESYHGQSEDILLRALQSPFPSLPKCGLDQVSRNDVLHYLNLNPGESDTETSTRLSAESSSSREALIPSVSYPLTEGKRMSILDLCAKTEPVLLLGGTQTGSKRKARTSEKSSKRCKLTQTSRFCHICVRSGEQVAVVPCSNIVGAVCRKATCEKCFEKHGLSHEWETAVRNRELIRQVQSGMLERLPEKAWTCLHCRSVCPPSAQCKIYARTNRRRQMILKQRKAEKEKLLAEREQQNQQHHLQNLHASFNSTIASAAIGPQPQALYDSVGTASGAHVARDQEEVCSAPNDLHVNKFPACTSPLLYVHESSEHPNPETPVPPRLAYPLLPKSASSLPYESPLVPPKEMVQLASLTELFQD